MPMLLGIGFALGTGSWIPFAVGFVAQWIFGNLIIPTLVVITALVLLAAL